MTEANLSGQNLAPSSTGYDDAPRSAMRILNSWSTQQSFRAKGGKTSEDTGERKKRQPETVPPTLKKKKEETKKQDPKIMPHETLADFNRRVESTLRGDVSRAIKSANSKKKTMENEAKKAKEQRKKPIPEEPVPKGVKRKHDVNDEPLEFASVPKPRRLNDIAQAPPSLPKLRVSKDEEKSVWSAKGKQERLMEIERERVIQKYREIKALKEEEKGRQREKEAKSGKKVTETRREYLSDSE